MEYVIQLHQKENQVTITELQVSVLTERRGKRQKADEKQSILKNLTTKGAFNHR